MMSLVPFIIAAGFLESYVTHNYQDLPEWSKWALIFISFGIIVFYYVVYPVYVARKHPELVDDENTYVFPERGKFNFHKIRDTGEILADTFQLYRSQFHKFGVILFTIILPLIGLVVWMQDVNHYELMLAQHWYDWQGQLTLIFGYGFSNGLDWVAFACWSVLMALIFSAVLWSVKTLGEAFSYGSFFQYLKERFASIYLANLLLFMVVFFSPWYILIIAFFVLPFVMVNAATAGLDHDGFGKRWGKGFKVSSQNYGTTLLNLLLLFVLVVIFSQTIASVFSVHNTYTNKPEMRDLLDILADFVGRVAMIFTDDYMLYSNIVRQFVYVLFILVVLPLLVISTAFGYYNVVEKMEAIGLKMEFEKFGKRKRNQETNVD